MTDQLQQILLGLEQQVAARTERLEIVATLGERLSSILNVEDLLNELVNQIQARFGYYHAHVYILDEGRENLIMTAGAGEAGAKMKEKGHSIPFTAPTSLVARSARNNEIVKVDNVREAPDWLPNPLLPDTYSEMAVPIMLEGKVVGVLDVQEDEIASLDEGDASLLRSLANQVAVAIRNASLFEEVETALSKAHALQEQYLERAWQDTIIAARGGQYHYTRPGISALDKTILAEAKQQAQIQDGPTIVTLGNDHQDSQPETQNQQSDSIVAPIKLRNKAIGTLQLHPADSNQVWTVDDLAIVGAVVDLIAQDAENLRLFSETQERAARERIISEIGDRIRRAPNLDVLLETAARELGQRLGAPQTVLELGVEREREASSGRDEENK
jgi:GAF domain-containing protein